MNLPEEIRNKEFSISLRGYNISEVEDYIEMLLEKYDTLYNENAELATSLGIKQAPTLVVIENGTVNKYTGVSEIKRYIG